jgi:hypothetical protein
MMTVHSTESNADVRELSNGNKSTLWLAATLKLQDKFSAVILCLLVIAGSGSHTQSTKTQSTRCQMQAASNSADYLNSFVDMLTDIESN